MARSEVELRIEEAGDEVEVEEGDLEGDGAAEIGSKGGGGETADERGRWRIGWEKRGSQSRKWMRGWG